LTVVRDPTEQRKPGVLAGGVQKHSRQLEVFIPITWLELPVGFSKGSETGDGAGTVNVAMLFQDDVDELLEGCVAASEWTNVRYDPHRPGAADIVCGGGPSRSIPSDRRSAGCLKARQRSGASSPEQRPERSGGRARSGEGGSERGSRCTHLASRPAQARPTPPRTGPCLLRRLWGSAEPHAGRRSYDAPKSGDHR
jgi:hypothetical protein